METYRMGINKTFKYFVENADNLYGDLTGL